VCHFLNCSFLGSKERDTETGLDHFVERYYSSLQGRFTSVDPLGASAKVSDPQTMNRYVFVLNNPLRYTDPDGLDAQNPWADLTDEEQRLITSKIKTVRKGQTVGERFNDLVRVYNGGKLDEQATTNRLLTVRNFIDATGAHNDSDLWNQITQIRGIDSNYLEISAKSEKGLVSAAKKQGFEEVLIEDKVMKAIGKGHHGNDSLRQISDNIFQPSMHFANDKGGNIYEVHWDPTSTSVRGNMGVDTGNPIRDWAIRQGLRASAGDAHGKQPLTPARVREDLKKRGLVPRTEQ